MECRLCVTGEQECGPGGRRTRPRVGSRRDEDGRCVGLQEGGRNRAAKAARSGGSRPETKTNEWRRPSA